MILGSLLLKREGLLYMVLCGGLFFIKMGYRGVRRRPGIPKKIILRNQKGRCTK